VSRGILISAYDSVSLGCGIPEFRNSGIAEFHNCGDQEFGSIRLARVGLPTFCQPCRHQFRGLRPCDPRI
jgi:hypothetical protein